MCMVWPCNSYVDGLSKKCINLLFYIYILIHHDCLPILMLLYIMLAYLMLFAALSNAFFAIDFFLLCLGLLTHSLFISYMIFHHAQCF